MGKDFIRYGMVGGSEDAFIGTPSTTMPTAFRFAPEAVNARTSIMPKVNSSV